MALAARRLASEYQNLCAKPIPGIVARPISEDSLFHWTFALAGPPDTPFHHGVFTGTLTFPQDYPLSPPVMRFTPPLLHPNVYPASGARAGEVCISILHSGRDETGYERAEERWSPVQSIQSILLSVLSMLSEPNVESPADVDAAKLVSQDPEGWRRAVRRQVERSLGLVG
jgi:ubiquitin-conjugating enzyme E2 G2